VITLNFIWHLHQPDYRLPGDRTAILPWVRLHAVKGYRDLLTILERYDHARCVVNFSGILLEQIDQIIEGTLTDEYARLTTAHAEDLSSEERSFVIKRFFSANERNLIRAHPRYYQLLQKREALLKLGDLDLAVEKFSNQEIRDLQVWFNLAWVGFTGKKRRDVVELIAQGREFTFEHQKQILVIHHEILAGLIDGYLRLADQGQIELTFTPFHHPILPLLINLARYGHHNPEDPLPQFKCSANAATQIRRGMEEYLRVFHRTPAGAWPAEGSVSDDALAAFANAGLQWVATDQQNLPVRDANPLAHLTPWQWEQNGSSLAVFFRDTRLSDNVGFEYASWQSAVAGAHLVRMAAATGAKSKHQDPVITIALDGENPWETYPDGGESFLCDLFERIAAEQHVHCRVPRQILEYDSLPKLTSVSAGSWINGNFDIWSRHPETRTAWRRLARTCNDLVDVPSTKVRQELQAAEGSDWFWWYGDDFITGEAEQFDALFRSHLIKAYELSDRDVPDEMYAPIVSERKPEIVGEVRGLVQPVLDGNITSFFEWRNAVQISGNGRLSAMAKSTESAITSLWYGFSEEAFYIRLDFTRDLLDLWMQDEGFVSVFLSQGEISYHKHFEASNDSEYHGKAAAFALKNIAELKIDLDETSLARGELAYLWVEVGLSEREIIKFPVAGRIPLVMISRDFATRNWVV
jgi:alpha-amylase/alpha-mannosidase (GH57 family)